jgi:hypothetical protein
MRLLGISFFSKSNKTTDDLGEAIDGSSRERCCGPDCCLRIYSWRDVVTNAVYVEYVKNGVKIFGTKAAYEADKLAGFP